MSQETSTEPTTLEFPGGDQMPSYRWAFNAFAILFLITLCIGFVNFLGTYIKNRV